MLRTRILTAVVVVSLVLAALYGLAPRGWAIVTLGIVAVGASEWADLSRLQGQAALLFVAVVLIVGLALLFAPAAGFVSERAWPAPVVVIICGVAALFWLIAAPVWLYSGWRMQSSIGLLSVGWLVLTSTWVAVVQIQARSPGLLLALMAIVWIADTAAYFAGRRFGRRKLAPSISPGKTWEGVYGGLLGVGVYALVLLWFAHDLGFSGQVSAGVVAAWVAIVLVIAGLSVLGDLFESHLKRERGVKDSGRLLPGHGGVLDRIDALTAAMPAAALIAHYVIR